MESYYSSDEEIAWGPITLREIKGDLKRPVRKPTKRHSMPYNFQMSSQIPCKNDSVPSADSKCNFLEELSKVINEPPQSQLSSYVSALDTTKTSGLTNESYVTLPDSSDNLNSSYHTAAADMNETYLNFVKKATERETHYDIANFQHTLIGSPVMSEGELVVGINEERLSSYKENSGKKNTSHNLSRKETTDEDVVVISDDEENVSDVSLENSVYDSELSQDGNSDVQETEAMYSRKDSSTTKRSLYKENASYYCDIISKKEQVNETEGATGSSVPQILVNGLLEQEATDNLNDDEISGDVDDSFDENCLHIGKYIHNEGTSSCSKSLSEREQVHEIEATPTTGTTVPRPLSTIPEKVSLSTSPISIPDIDLAQFDDSVSKNESLQLNDTLEEINRLLNEGLNYRVSDDESIIDNTPLKSEPRLDLQFTPSNIISGSFSQKQSPIQTSNSKLKATKTPSGAIHTSEKRQIPRYNVKKTPDNHFKVPEKPVRSKLTNPTPPKSCPSHLKNVMSPVALYIKNSPSVPLKQNVPQRELTKITPSKIPKASSKENFPDFPEVVYKPSKKQISSCEKEVVLPPSIKKLNVKEPIITKHEGRIHQRSNRAQVGRKLLEDDITDRSIDCSMLNSSKDISVLTKKQAFIK